MKLAHETEIGLGLTGFGVFFSFLGILFFFDKGLLAMGNVSYIYFDLFYFVLFSVTFSNALLFFCHSNQILFVSGVSLTIGLKSTLQFFMKPSNFKVPFCCIWLSFTWCFLPSSWTLFYTILWFFFCWFFREQFHLALVSLFSY